VVGVAQEKCAQVERTYAWLGVVLQRRPSLVRCFLTQHLQEGFKLYAVVPRADGEELTIWDSKESEFSSGLEYAKIFSSSDHVNDLDWSSTPDGQSILAVGFAYRVEVLCQQRMTYFDEGPGWGVIKSIGVERWVNVSCGPKKTLNFAQVCSRTQSMILSG
jgi:RAVE protein 1 C terminal